MIIAKMSFPAEIYCTHVFPLFDNALDARNGFNVFVAPYFSSKERAEEEFIHHWLRSPRTDILFEDFVSKNWDAYITHIEAYPEVVLLRDGHILTELLWAAIHVHSHVDAFDIVTLFVYSIQLLLNGTQDPKKNLEICDIIRRNVERFMRRVLHAFESDRHVFVDMLVFVLEKLTQAPLKAADHDFVLFDPFAPTESSRSFWRAFLRCGLKADVLATQSRTLHTMVSLATYHRFRILTGFAKEHIDFITCIIDDILSLEYTHALTVPILVRFLVVRIIHIMHENDFSALEEREIKQSITRVITFGFVRALVKPELKVVDGMIRHFRNPAWEESFMRIDPSMALDIAHTHFPDSYHYVDMALSMF